MPERIEPTAPPRRSEHPPREGIPVTSLTGEPIEHWRKHPSDYHADCATGAMSSAMAAVDTVEKDRHMKVAEVHALLSVRDAMLEAVATVRETTSRLIESNTKLDADLQKAAQVLHKDGHDLKAQLRVIQERAA